LCDSLTRKRHSRGDPVGRPAPQKASRDLTLRALRGPELRRVPWRACRGAAPWARSPDDEL